MNRFASAWYPTLLGVVAMCLVTYGYVCTHPEPSPIDFERATAG